MHSRWGAVAGTILIVVVVAAFSLVAMPKPALACTCDGRQQAAVDLVGQVDLAFVGSVVSEEVLDPPMTGRSSQFDLRYEVVVDHAVKGLSDGDRVVMFGDSLGSSCGTTELTGQGKLEVIVSRSNGGLYAGDSTPACTGLPSINEMLSLDLALPEVSTGVVSTIVAGRMGEAELIAFDAGGNPLAYADLGVGAGPLAICPGSQTFVHLEQGDDQPHPDLVVRESSTLQVVERVEVVLPADVRGPGFFVYGASLHCLASDGLDVLAVTPREQSADDQTNLLHIRPDDQGGIVRTTYDDVSRARFDDFTGDVIGVTDGDLRRYPIDGPSIGQTVARVSATNPESDNTVFTIPNGAGGYWIGLGDGEYGVATRVLELVQVTARGDVERWPVTPPAIEFDSAVLSGDALHGFDTMLKLPEPGSSAARVVAPEAPGTRFSYNVHLGDGRSIANVDSDAAAPFELRNADGSAVALRQLGQVRHVISVPNGPVADPAFISVDLDPGPVASEWISSADGSADLAQHDPGPESASNVELPSPDSTTGGSPSRWFIPAIVMAAGAMFTLGLHRWRLR